MIGERELAAACALSDIVIADRWLPASCHPRWLKADRNLLERSGGLAIDLARGQAVSVEASQGEHGWWRPSRRVFVTPLRGSSAAPQDERPLAKPPNLPNAQ